MFESGVRAMTYIEDRRLVDVGEIGETNVK